MVHSKIQQYLRHSCSSQIAKRGKDLFDSGAVLSCEYEPERDEGGGAVKGTKNYLVAVHNLLDEHMEIETYCNCPYDWDDVCKHQVAMLYAIEAKFDMDNEASVSPKTNFGELLLTPRIFDEFQKSAEINGVTVSPLAISEDQIRFEVEVKSSYHWSKEVIQVNITRTDKQWNIENCCKTSFNQVCKHQSAVIYYIRKHWNGFRFFEKITELDPAKVLARKAYHLLETTDFYDFFNLSYDTEKQEFKFVPKDNAFKSREDMLGFISSYKDLKEKSAQVGMPFRRETESSMGYGLAFYFDHRSRKKNDFYVQLITGKTNSAKTKLVNSFRMYDGLSWAPEELRLFGEKLNYLMRQRIFFDSPESNFNLISEYLVENLPLLAKQQNFQNEDLHVASKAGLKPIVIQPEPLKINFELLEQDGFYHLAANISYQGGTLPLSKEMDIVCGHFFTMGQEYFIIPDYLTFATMATLLDAPVLIIHRNEKKELLQVLNELSKQHDIELNGLIPVEQLSLHAPKFQVYLSEVHAFLIIKPEVMYENGERFSLMSEEYAWSFDAEAEIAHNVTRNNEAEDTFRQLLFDFDPAFKPDTHLSYYFKSYDEIQHGNWFFAFFALCQQNNIEVFGLKDLKRMKYSPYTASVDLGISSNIDWFEAHLTVRFGEEIVPLKKLHQALERRENFVKLGDGSLGMLPEKWIKKLNSVLRAGEIKNENIQINKLKFNLVDQLFEEIDDLEVLNEINEKKHRLQSFSEIREIDIPETVTATLRGYQKEGFYWMNFLDEFGFGGCLADDMGLGKTLQLITFLAHQQAQSKGTSLVIVPKSLLFNWSGEIEKFCPSLKFMHYHGNRTFDKHVFAQCDVIIATYNTVANDIAKLKTFPFNYVVLDESQAIKNPLSKRYKSVCLLKSRNRLVATGTPIENNTFDLYAQFNFLNPGLLGSQVYFKEQYAVEIDGKGDLERANELKHLIHPFLLRRTKQQVANDLPEKTEQILTVEMGEEQRAVYDFYLQRFRDYILNKVDDEGIENSKMYVLEGLMKLRQICNSPALLKKSEFDSQESAKIELLMEQLLPLVKTNKVLVFSQFTSMLALIQARLEAANIQFSYLDGKTNKRQEIVNEFNNGDANRVFLISLKAGGTGLNLTSADYVFLVDPWWNPAAEAQAIDRTHRIGQKNHVFAYKMICENSIEEKILKLQEKKKMLSEDLIQAQENFVRGLKRKDIEILFS